MASNGLPPHPDLTFVTKSSALVVHQTMMQSESMGSCIEKGNIKPCDHRGSRDSRTCARARPSNLEPKRSPTRSNHGRGSDCDRQHPKPPSAPLSRHRLHLPDLGLPTIQCQQSHRLARICWLAYLPSPPPSSHRHLPLANPRAPIPQCR